MDATGLTFPVPAGEGVGLGVILAAGDQSTAALPWTLSYANASVARVAAASAFGVPTTGGTRIVLVGRGFGYHVPGSPTAWGWSPGAVAAAATADWVRSPADPAPPIVELDLSGASALAPGGGNGSTALSSWVQCVNVLRLNDSALSCAVPEGDGARLSVRITVANAPPAVLAGVFSYDPPVIASVECAGPGCSSGSTRVSSVVWTPSSNASLQGLILAQGAPAGGYSEWTRAARKETCGPSPRPFRSPFLILCQPSRFAASTLA